MNLFTFILFVAGIALLIVGGDLLVRGAGRITTALGISPLVIGLTVVAFGTSAPEAAVIIQSALAGEGDIALGNVIGSNIFNILVSLGVSAAVTPLLVMPQLLRVDVPLSIAGWSIALPNSLRHRASAN
jgi:cation:H+ antiporter